MRLGSAHSRQPRLVTISSTHLVPWERGQPGDGRTHSPTASPKPACPWDVPKSRARRAQGQNPLHGNVPAPGCRAKGLCAQRLKQHCHMQGLAPHPSPPGTALGKVHGPSPGHKPQRASPKQGSSSWHGQGLHTGHAASGTCPGDWCFCSQGPAGRKEDLALRTSPGFAWSRSKWPHREQPTDTSHRAAAWLLAREGSIHRDGEPKPCGVRGWQETRSVVRTSICRPKNRKQLQPAIVAARQPPAGQAAGTARPGTRFCRGHPGCGEARPGTPRGHPRGAGQAHQAPQPHTGMSSLPQPPERGQQPGAPAGAAAVARGHLPARSPSAPASCLQAGSWQPGLCREPRPAPGTPGDGVSKQQHRLHRGHRGRWGAQCTPRPRGTALAHFLLLRSPAPQRQDVPTSTAAFPSRMQERAVLCSSRGLTVNGTTCSLHGNSSCEARAVGTVGNRDRDICSRHALPGSPSSAAVAPLRS